MRWPIALAIIGIMVGIVSEAAPLYLPGTPYWIWGIILWAGFAAIIGAAVWAAWPVLRRRLPRRSAIRPAPWRDWNMKQGLQWWEKTHGADATERGLEFFSTVRQAALDGHITVWGRRNMQMFTYKDYAFRPLEEIPSEHWKHHDFDSVRYIYGDEKATIREASSPPSGEIAEVRYYDLTVTSREIQSLWPVGNT